jgi:hypothetical protein
VKNGGEPGSALARGRVRCLGWVSAVVLLVLLAAAGLPSPGQQFAAGERVAACVEDVSIIAVRAAARRLGAIAAGPRSNAQPAPRPASRWRCLPCGGLPPLRAPPA